MACLLGVETFKRIEPHAKASCTRGLPPQAPCHCGVVVCCMQVVPLAQLEEETLVWCREMLRNSPTALRVLKSALNAAEDGQAGIQQLGGDATMLFYQSEEGNEGRAAYLEKRPPDFSKFPRLP